MRNIAVVGGFYGDEAKARIAHYLAKDYKYIVRFSGSENAGHTLYHKGKKIVRSLIPSADFSVPDQYAFLGSGMVINPTSLYNEIKRNQEVFPYLAKKIIVDPDAFIISQDHVEQDKANVSKIGSTGKGVTPAYVDKINRNGTKLSALIRDNAPIIQLLKEEGVQFKYCYQLYNEFKQSPILFEGSQSVLLDYNFGSHPNVTSGECGLNGIINAGFAEFIPEDIYGVIKCYSTRVGNGPYPTELFGKEAEELREKGEERGAVTGRPRRTGWLDLPALKYACNKSGINKLVITKFDVLNGMSKVPVCTSYDKELICSDDFNYVKPNYTYLDGWKNARDVSQLLPFISLVESTVNRKVEYVTYGVNENDVCNIAEYRERIITPQLDLNLYPVQQTPGIVFA